MRFTVPVKTRNPLNGPQGRTQGAMRGKAARRKKEREAAHLCALAAPMFTQIIAYAREGLKEEPQRKLAHVILVRLSSGKLDGDGLQAALKSVRDGVADALGINDGSSAIIWEYAQRKCKRGEFGVEVEIT